MDEKAIGAAADDDESEPESNPEWFENGEPIVDDKEHEMTFDEEGKYVLAKEVVGVAASDENKSKSGANKGEKSSGSFQTGVSSTPSISSSSNASSSSTSPSDPNNAAASKTSTAASYLKPSASNNESISKSSSFSAFPPYHQHHNYDLLDQNKVSLRIWFKFEFAVLSFLNVISGLNNNLTNKLLWKSR